MNKMDGTRKKTGKRPKPKPKVANPPKLAMVYLPVLEKALELAGGDEERCEVISATEVIVR